MPDKSVDEALTAVRDLGLDEQAFPAADATARAALEQEYEREQRGGARPPRRLRLRLRRALLIPIGLLAAGALAAGGYAALSGSSSTASAGIMCHDNPSLSGGGAVIDLDGRSATKSCAELWTKGLVKDGVHQVPAPLHACVAGEGGGAIHVFASADQGICEAEGLREDRLAGTNPNARRFAGFEKSIDVKLNTKEFECPTLAKMRGLVDDEMLAAGLKGWSVDTLGDFGADTCASLSFDSDAKTVTITSF